MRDVKRSGWKDIAGRHGEDKVTTKRHSMAAAEGVSYADAMAPSHARVGRTPKGSKGRVVMPPAITSEVVVAYAQCPRKAYFLLFGQDKGEPHEYVQILAQQQQENHARYLAHLRQKHTAMQPYSLENLRDGSAVLINARLQGDGLEAECGILTRGEGQSTSGPPCYEPTICVGTYNISEDQKRELVFVGYVLAHVQRQSPVAGSIIGMDGTAHTVKLGQSATGLLPLLAPLRAWTTTASPEPPPIILNKHCPLCPFQRVCQAQAEQEDNLSLLDSLSTAKMVKKYERKGIFTVNQLSYLYRPRKQRKRSRKTLAPRHDVALQALVMRTGKIFILKTPELSRQPVEIFLDIEGIPDQHMYYLMGLLICDGESCAYHALWADTLVDEERMWHQFLTMIQERPHAPIYHYGSYEPKAIATLGRRYHSDTASITTRLVNVNASIYGKVYFPLRSNKLKDIGVFLGASWTASDASGLQSLVWRDHWEKTGNMLYRQRLMTYNEEDCRALKVLTDVLSGITEREDAVSNIDYYIHAKKSRSSKTDNPLHEQLETILKFAHSSYNKQKIHFHKVEQDDGNKAEEAPKRTGTPHRKKYRKPTRSIQISQAMHCPVCGCDRLAPSQKTTERMLVDLTFTQHGVRKSVAKYWAYKGRCPTCRHDLVPHDFAAKGRPQFLGAGFKVWITYLRVALRLPYGSIHKMFGAYHPGLEQ
jgi:predicted RecB family nuclease